MFYRTNLLTHSRRVSWLVENISPYAVSAFGNNFNPEKAIILALVHDDAEIIMGDYQAGNKAKMNEDQLKELDDIEKKAIDEIAERWPSDVGRFNYRELLTAARLTDSLEAEVVKYADKAEGLAEALHEVYAGNKLFTQNVHNEYGRIPTYDEYYMPYLAMYAKYYPSTTKLFELGCPLLAEPEIIDFGAIAATAKPHTLASLHEASGHDFYDAWKNIILARAKNEPEELNYLITIKEY